MRHGDRRGATRRRAERWSGVLASSLPLTTATFALLLAGTSALASPRGTYDCRMVTGSGHAIIDFSATGYRYSSADAKGRVQDKVNGTGSYDYADPYVLPLDGPLLTGLDVTGSVAGGGDTVEFRRDGKVVLTCARRPN